MPYISAFTCVVFCPWRALPAYVLLYMGLPSLLRCCGAAAIAANPHLHCFVLAASATAANPHLLSRFLISFLRQAQLRLIRTCCLVSLYCVVSQLRRIRTCCLVCYCVVSHLRRIRIFAFYRTCGTTASLRILSQLRHNRIFAYTIATAAHPHHCDLSHLRLVSISLRAFEKLSHLRLIRTFSISGN